MIDWRCGIQFSALISARPTKRMMKRCRLPLFDPFGGRKVTWESQSSETATCN
jgi:hypothetical protein